jgi:two-component system nitrogen regulation response regulator NtrX
MFIMYGGSTVSSDRLPPEFKHAMAQEKSSSSTTETENDSMDTLISDGPADLKQARADFEARFLEAKLKECDGNISQLAKAVGMERSSLYRKLKTYKIQTD